MNSKKIVKIAVILMLIATILMTVNVVLGTVNMPKADGSATSNIQNPVQRIMGIVQYICYAAAIILIVILGVRFMVASPDGKAEIKKSAVIYVIGAFLVFAAGAIIGILNTTSNTVAS